MLLELSTRQVEPGITVFEFRGRLTLGNRLTEIEHSIKAELQSGCRKLVLDLGGLEFIDSAGLGMLVMCAGAMEQTGGRMCVTTTHPRILHLFEITHLERVVALHADAETACRSLGATGTAAAG
jgi:anti-sigma B factor antagonist